MHTTMNTPNRLRTSLALAALSLALLPPLLAAPAVADTRWLPDPKPRVFVLTDISNEPDDDTFEVRWWIYPEASSLRDAKGRRFPPEVTLSISRGSSTSLVAPTVTKPETVHVILEVEDRGSPSLFAYRRAVISIKP